MANFSKRVQKTGKGREHSFIQLPHYILKSEEFGRLTAYELKALLELAKEYKGNNNGDLSVTYKTAKHRGWRSAGTLSAAVKGLERKRWTLCTRHGGSHRCNLYAITWWPLNECDGKSLYKAESKPRHEWRENTLGSRNADSSDRYADSNDDSQPK